MKVFNDWFFALQIKDIVSLIAWVLGGISIIIEFNKKIPLHPLSHIVKWMGSILNRETLEKLDEIAVQSAQVKEEVKDISDRLTQRVPRVGGGDPDKRAVDMRNQIIDFSENLRLGKEYSVKQFESALGVVSRYHDHCERHNIKNHYIDGETEFIREKFHERKQGR